MPKLGEDARENIPIDTFNNPENYAEQEKYKTQIDQKNSRNNKLLGFLVFLTVACFTVLGLMAGGVIPLFEIPQIGFGFVETTLAVAGVGLSSMLMTGVVAGSGITRVQDRKYEYKKLPDYTGLSQKTQLSKSSAPEPNQQPTNPFENKFPVPPPPPAPQAPPAPPAPQPPQESSDTGAQSSDGGDGVRRQASRIADALSRPPGDPLSGDLRGGPPSRPDAISR